MFSVAASSVNLLRGGRPRPRRLDNNRFTDDNNTKKQKLLLLSSCNYSNNVRRRRSRCVVSSSASGGGSEWRPPSSPAVHDVAPGAPDEPRVAYTHTSAHAHVPHTVTVTVSRPASRHITVAPQLLPAPHHAYTELEPGDVLICIADEWHQPTELFVEQIDFGEISRWLTEEGDRPMTLRFERYPQAGWWSIHTHHI